MEPGKVKIAATSYSTQPTTVDQNFYSQWERKLAHTATNNSGAGTRVRPLQHSFSPLVTNKTSSANKSTHLRHRNLARLTTTENDETEKTQLLELQIMSTKSAIANCKKRERQLIESNLVLKKEIVAEERPNHEAVKILMRRYEKFRGGISYLNDNFTSTLKYESDQLRQLEERLEKDLNFLENEVGVLDAKLQERQNQVYVLNNYKDKEYPVKAIRIGELLTEIDQVELANDDEYYDLERVIDDELQKLSREGNQEQTSIKESALNSVLNQMHPSLKEMAKQNQVMQAEIDYHKEQIASLSLNVESLRQEVKQLLAHPKTNVRLQIFPELFKYETKCTPDMDVVLDIPRAELLPI